VPRPQLGSALALLGVALNAGIAGANYVAGRLNDAFHAGAANPAGYAPMMAFFFGAGALGLAFALVLWRTAGRRSHEIAYNLGTSDGSPHGRDRVRFSPLARREERDVSGDT
jgi:hypothetical protein